jgi:hypothetical protein
MSKKYYNEKLDDIISNISSKMNTDLINFLEEVWDEAFTAGFDEGLITGLNKENKEIEVIV